MKTLLEQDDIQAIASAVVDMLKPMLSSCNGSGKHSREEVILDKKGAAEYLKVSESTISRMVSNKQIPHFKIQAGQSGAVRFRQRDLDKWIQRQVVTSV
jgi:excisionase family DNA binding protein